MLWSLVLTELAREQAQGCHPRPLHPTAMRSIWAVVDDQLTLLVQVPSVLMLPLVVVRRRMQLLSEVPLLVPPPLPLPQSPQRPQWSSCFHRECRRRRHGAFLEPTLQSLQCCQWQQAQVEQRGSWQQRPLHVPFQLQVKRPALWVLAAEAAASLLGSPHIPPEQLQHKLQQQVPSGHFLW